MINPVFQAEGVAIEILWDDCGGYVCIHFEIETADDQHIAFTLSHHIAKQLGYTILRETES